MTAEAFRRMALSLPEATEGQHMDHPDFRVQNKIFATLWPDGKYGMIKLTPEQQKDFTLAEPDVFQPCSGVWGRRGSTRVTLALAKEGSIRTAVRLAWTNSAPKKLARQR